MKTYDDLRKEIARVKKIDIEGFDNNWVFKKFTRNQALINIEIVKPYTDKYNLIIEFLVTGTPDLASGAASAASAAASAAAYASASAAAYAAANASANAAAYEANASANAANAAADAADESADAVYAAANAAADAVYAAAYAANANHDYSPAILNLQKISNDYLALLQTNEVVK